MQIGQTMPKLPKCPKLDSNNRFLLRIQAYLTAVICGFWWGICCINPPTFAQAASKETPDTLQDYRYHMELNTGQQQGAYRLPLPQAVYLHSRSSNLDDVRLFDAKGTKIPYARLQPVAQAWAQRKSIPVTLFPIYGNVNHTDHNKDHPANNNMALDIQTRADGSLISVKTRSNNPAAGNKLHTLVLDLQPALPATANDPTLVEALRFTLPTGQTTYWAQIWMEASDDLQHWEPVGTAEVRWLVNDDAQTLASDRLEFQARRLRYARITWRKGDPIAFAAIHAETVLPVSAAPALETLLIAPTAGKEEKDLAYPSAPGIPVESLALQFSEANAVFPTSIGYYDELPSKQVGQAVKWRFHALTQATFYQITQDGQLRTSGDIKLPNISHQAEWVLRSPQAGSIKPSLRLRWQAASLVFVASGTPPYTLAFGRANATAGAQDMAQDVAQVAPGFNMEELQKLAVAKTGPLQQQTQNGSESASKAALVSAAAQKRTLVLWGVLLLGVGILGGMAWSLLKQMKQKQ